MTTEDRLISAGVSATAVQTDRKPVKNGQVDNGLLGTASRVAGWAARTGVSAARKLPGAGVAERGAREVERRALVELRKRLETVGDPTLVTLRTPERDVSRDTASPDAVVVVPARDGEVEPLRAAMAELLNRSIGFGRERSREYLYAVILRQLTPDEARVLATMADGTPFPLVDVVERGRDGRVLLRNASTVGKAAGVTLADHVPDYVTRLVEFGLVDVESELDALSTQYEVLLTDDEVRAAQDGAKRAKIVRHTARISRLGIEFWRSCDPARP